MEHPADDYDRVEFVESMVNLSRTPAGRARLNADGALAGVLCRLSSSTAPVLISRLRLVRNLCADEPANQDAFVESGGVDRLASVFLTGLPVSTEVVRTVSQVLGNVASAGEAHRAAVWARFFPVWFRKIAEMYDPAVCNSLCMVLDTCCSATGGRRRLGELCDAGRGLPIVLDIVYTMSRGCHKEEYFYWLLGKACMEGIYFTRVFQGLSSTIILDGSGGVDCTYKKFSNVQVFLLETLSDYLTGWPGYLDSISKHFALSVLQVLKEASSVVDASSQSNYVSPTCWLGTDILKKQVQDDIRKQDGISLLLQQCVVDECWPLLREWATLSVRYLLDGNLENQYKVAELEQKEPVITPEISRMGLRVEVDQESQRQKIVNASSVSIKVCCTMAYRLVQAICIGSTGDRESREVRNSESICIEYLSASFKSLES
ncbi:hypothetical protein C4D60_Mb05t07500 [Musa balbisiana]|uniref:Ataxin-10 domain-containing protein n=1 Tax=Musa balbisiana TaxID=52838 RepID=A0A4S8JUF2_MUSBA|nr:hypothetical protein C4D60_Mb05t07500 [Musa balbisiana]